MIKFLYNVDDYKLTLAVIQDVFLFPEEESDKNEPELTEQILCQFYREEVI